MAKETSSAIVCDPAGTGTLVQINSKMVPILAQKGLFKVGEYRVMLIPTHFRVKTVLKFKRIKE